MLIELVIEYKFNKVVKKAFSFLYEQVIANFNCIFESSIYLELFSSK